jgi:hypothetical protein
MDLALHNKETQNKPSDTTFNLKIPYKPKYEKKNQLEITVKKNKEPK